MLERRPAKILTIDDEYVLRQSIVAYLEDSGFEVFEGENGIDGLEIFRKEKPDLILADLQMPGMGGLEVLTKVGEESPETPVIVISGAGGMNDVIEALRLGAWDYLTKPVTDLAVLEHAVCRALERCRLIEENKIYAEQLAKNLQILEEDQEAGRSVQKRLLPEQGVSFSGYSFAHSVTPSLYLSGDFVDYFKISEDKLGFYLADVSGHGASSAFITVLLKSLVSQIHGRFQVHNDKTILTPEHIMEELSYEIHSAALGKYLTMIYGVIDLKTDECIYGVGGHYPNPILLGADGKASYLSGSGFPVGIMKTVSYKSETVKLEKNSHLMLFSDGVMEILLPEKDMAEKDQALLDIIEEVGANVPEILKRCGLSEEELEQPDDITMLVVSHT